MKLHYFLLLSLSTLTPLFSSEKKAIHVKQIPYSITRISFNKERKPIIIWLQKSQNNAFGKTPIFRYTKNEQLIFENRVKKLNEEEFQMIAAGCAFYCKGIKKQKGIYYGAIVINDTDSNSLNPYSLQDIYWNIKMQFRKNSPRLIPLDF